MRLFLRPQGPMLIGDSRTLGSGFHRSSAFPMPQAVLGAARARMGEALGFHWNFSKTTAEEHDRILSVVGTPDAPGSLRVESLFLSTRRFNEPPEVLYPRPLDIRVFQGDPSGFRWHGMRPTGDSSVAVSAPAGLGMALAPLMHRPEPGGRKPASDPPMFVDRGLFESFLLDPAARVDDSHIGPTALPLVEDHTHVVIDNEALSADEGKLYSAGRLSFDVALSGADLGISVNLAGTNAVDLSGFWRIGGKGSLAFAASTDPDPGEAGLKLRALDAIGATEGRLRWVLTGPARFRQGWLPDFIGTNGEGTVSGVTVALRAAAVGRPVAYAGWDLAASGSDSSGRARGAARPTRLFVPAGSVYFLEVMSGRHGETPAAAARRLAEEFWMQELCPVAQSRQASEAERRADAIDAASGLGRGVFGPWQWFEHR